MADHAGFAAAISIGQPAMRRLVRTLYAANKIPHVLTARQTLPVTGGGTVNLNVHMFCGVPAVTFAADSDDRVVLGLRCWGTLAFDFAGGAFDSSEFELTATLATPISLAVIDGGGDLDGDGINDVALSFSVDGSAAEIIGQPALTQLAGNELSSQTQEFIDSDSFGVLLQLAVRGVLAEVPAATIPMGFLGGLQLASTITPAARFVDGALLIGLDVTWGAIVAGLVPVYPANVVQTHGDPRQLHDFRGRDDLAFVVAPEQVPIYLATALAEIKSQIPDDVVIDRMDLVLHDGFLRVAGSARAVVQGATLGTAAFSFAIVPRLTTDQQFAYRETLGFVVRDVQVDVQLSALTTAVDVIVGVLTLGATALGVNQLVAAIRGSLVRQIGSQGRAIGPRNQQFTLTGTTRPVIDVRVQTFEFHPDRLAATMRLRPRLGAPRISGTSRIFGRPTRVQVFYACTLPADVLPSDPHLRVSWTLRRLDRNLTVDAKDAPASENRSYRADLTVDNAVAMSLQCRVYRTLGVAVENLFNKTVTLRPTDRLDHSHPFVHWAGTVPLPAFVKNQDGSLTRNGIASVDRVSKIHRTDLPGRCLFADSYGPVITQTPDYLDDLPFPRSQLVLHRDKVCDYCFFGGPDKNAPLI